MTSTHIVGFWLKFLTKVQPSFGKFRWGLKICKISDFFLPTSNFFLAKKNDFEENHGGTCIQGAEMFRLKNF